MPLAVHAGFVQYQRFVEDNLNEVFGARIKFYIPERSLPILTLITHHTNIDY